MLGITNHDEVDADAWTPWGIAAVEDVADVEIGSPFPTDDERFAQALRDARHGPLPEVGFPGWGKYTTYEYDDQYKLHTSVREERGWEQNRIRVVGEKKLIVGNWEPYKREELE